MGLLHVNNVEYYNERSDKRGNLFRDAVRRLDSTLLSAPIWAFSRRGLGKAANSLWGLVYLKIPWGFTAFN
jgi:hypothetical protein